VITRPLDLLSKLRPPPRNFDFLFLVNGALIVLFFILFGSRFVLSPGLSVNGTAPELPVNRSAIDGAVATPVSVSVNASEQIFVDTGLVTQAQLREWLVAQGKRHPGSALLLIVDARVSTDVITQISEAATTAGFAGVQIASQAAPSREIVFP
jgi:biopolymer transport protein ExbD